MSFLLDPPALVILGIGLLLVKKLLRLSGQQIRIIGALILIVFISVSSALFFDLIDWPFNIFDWSPPMFQPISGKEWMLHTDITGIKDIPLPLAIFFFILYPCWLWLGYEISRDLFDPHALKILPGGPFTINDVKSYERRKKPNEETLISVVRNEDSQIALKEALEKIGGIKAFIKPTDKVLIKANISGGNPLSEGSFTTIKVVDKIIEIIKEETGVIPIVVDSDMVWTDFEPVAKAQGWYKWSKEKRIDLKNLRKTDCVQFDFGINSTIKTTIVSKNLLDADVIISVPTMKTHLLTDITCGMKNMYGTLPTGEKAQYHKMGIENVIVDVNTAFQPTLTIIDGSIGGESIGPLSCRPVYSDIIIASNDVVAADATAAEIMGYDPSSIDHIQKAQQLEIGKIIPLDWNQLEGKSHPKDRNWVKPDPVVTDFYNQAIETILIVPGMKKFMNAASDFVLFDLATLPLFENTTPVALGVISDILGATFGIIYGEPKGGLKKKKIATKIGEKIKESELYPNNEYNTFIDEFFTKQGIKSCLIASIMILLGVMGFVFGGFLEKAMNMLESQENNLIILIFILGFISCCVSLFIYAPKLKPMTLIQLTVFSSLFAFLDEYIFTSLELWTYLSGDTENLLFAVLGWPIFITVIFAFSDWTIKFINIPIFKSHFRNSLPIIGLIIISGFLFTIEAYIPILITDQITLYLVGAVLLLLSTSFLSLYFSWNHTFRQNIILMIFGMIFGTLMELIGLTCDFWTYHSDFIVSPPIFLIFLWSIRVLAIGGLMTFLKTEILKWGFFN